MKKNLLAAAVLAAFSVSAFAADVSPARTPAQEANLAALTAQYQPDTAYHTVVALDEVSVEFPDTSGNRVARRLSVSFGKGVVTESGDKWVLGGIVSAYTPIFGIGSGNSVGTGENSLVTLEGYAQRQMSENVSTWAKIGVGRSVATQAAPVATNYGMSYGMGVRYSPAILGGFAVRVSYDQVENLSHSRFLDKSASIYGVGVDYQF